MSLQEIKGKTFKQYYEDPEFKAKHLARLKQKIQCACGAEVSRSNMATHKKSLKHSKAMKEIYPQDYQEVLNKLEELENKLNQIKLT